MDNTLIINLLLKFGVVSVPHDYLGVWVDNEGGWMLLGSKVI